MKALTINRACIVLRVLGYNFRISWRYHVSGALRPRPEFSYWKEPDWDSMEIEVHKGCGEECYGVGEDAISYCPGCGCVEGDTEYITYAEYEARA